MKNEKRFQSLLLVLISFHYIAYAQPVISSFSPESGMPGTSVTITGKNFATKASANIVYFGAVKGKVESAGATSLMVTVPYGATTEPISVTVSNLTAYSPIPFNVVSTGGGGKFKASSFRKVLDLFGGLNPRSAVVADFNADGKADIAVSNQSSNSVSVF